MNKKEKRKKEKDLPVALVTGAAVRIGAVIASYLSANSYRVALHCNSSLSEAELLKSKIESAGNSAFICRADLTRPKSAANLIEQVIEKARGLDLLVNSAGVIYADTTSLHNLALMNSLNCEAPSKLIDAALPYLKERRGSIVNIADIAGIVEYPKYKVYSKTKKTLLLTTLRVARENAASGVRVNAVCPGTVLFPSTYTEKQKNRIIGKIPMGHPGTPDDIADTVLYLANAKFVTGQVIAVDGGRLLEALEGK